MLDCFGANAQSNVYHPFPLVDGATWKVSWQDHDCILPPNYGEARYEYHILHDALINSITYKILEQGPNVSTVPGCFGPAGPVATLLGGLRQDTVARKVYFLDGFVTEELLFDYTLQVGDTLKGYLTLNSGYVTSIVQSIDSLLIGTEYHRRLSFGARGLVEGMGSNFGLLESPQYFEAGSSLICFSINNTNYYGTTGDCSLDLSTISETKASKATIYPNPATDEFTVLLNNPVQKLTVALYNLTGQQVATYSAAGKQITIPRNNLPVGMYLIKVDADSKQLYQKIVQE